MADLQNVDVTLPNGLKTTFRVSPDKAARYKKMGEKAAKSRGAKDKARRPVTAPKAGDVETK